MNSSFYTELSQLGLQEKLIEENRAKTILTDPRIDILSLLNAAYSVRKEFVGNEVLIHIINNGQNGFCPEDCSYCAQAKSSQADIEEYSIKSDEEFIQEAKDAHEKGAHRYCMVFAGRGPSLTRVEHLAGLIRKIKEKYPIEICVSCGLLDAHKAKILKEAGLNRLNHNLNTSRKNYSKICTTHTYQDRLNTLQAGKQSGVQLCSGLIIGMGETADDIIEVAYTLRDLNVESIPVNFFIPIDGNKLQKYTSLKPEYCLRILCLYRLLNPRAEIRIAAGREMHLRSMEVLALYPANSLFLDGYLNARGEERLRTYQMISDAGFKIKSQIPLNNLILNEKNCLNLENFEAQCSNILPQGNKTTQELRPYHQR